VEGAYDLHVHIAPDVMLRRITDLELAPLFLHRGLAGFGLKSHYFPTAERASVINAAVPGIDAVGALTLNSAVGGMNPIAVEMAARAGARIVWMPTVDARNHRENHDLPVGATPPMWMALQRDLADKGVEVPIVEILAADGSLLPEVEAVLGRIAEHNLILATGHLGACEIERVVEGAVAAGVKHIVVTHPEFPMQALSVPQQQELVAQGALMERCLTTPLTGKCTWEDMFAAMRAVGIPNNLVTTDLGQPHAPAVEDGLAIFADEMLSAEFTEDDVRTIIVDNSRRLALGVAER
jgi:hypothetical protein